MPTLEPPAAEAVAVVERNGPGNVEQQPQQQQQQQQNENNNNNNSNNPNNEPTMSTRPIIGIIYPPPEVRNIVDKTASFVARNGPEFEARIRQNEINNPKFNFLNSGDPYNAYYQHKVKEFREGKSAAPEAPMGTMSKPLSIPAKQAIEVLKVIEQTIILKEPPPEFEFIADPPSISAFDLDIVKLTAQFVARNGRQFLTNLMNREQRNYQFDFLRPQHSLFNYFTKLLEEYTKVLIPPKDLMNKLKRETQNPKVVLDQLKYRVEWTKLQEAQKRREEEEAERERVAYAQVDWHDFVIVETVDYQPHEHGNFPPPTTPEEVGTRVLAQERYDVSQEVEMEVDSDQELSDGEDDIPGVTPLTQDNTQVQDMEEGSSSDDEGTTDAKGRPRSAMTPHPPSDNAPQPPPLPPLPDQVVIRKDYNPKVHKITRPPITDEFLISPITGEKIPANKVQEHMRIGLLDPRWVEQRDRTMHERLQQEEVYAQGSAIESSLKQLAERRTDIFGFGDEETAIGKKIGEEERKRDEKVTWDGHTASMEAATRAARANITIEEQIHQIHKVKGLLPDEEKERIGPAKPSLGAQISKATIVAAPTLATPRPGPPMSGPQMAGPRLGNAPPLPQAPPQPLPPLPPMPPQPMMPQGMMMVGRPPVGGPPMRPPPLMGMHQRPPMPPMPPTMPPGTPYQQMPRPPAAPPRPPPPAEEEPPSKKQKSEDTLIPEAEFMRKYKSPATFKVQIPHAGEKPEWKLNGQVLTFTLPLTDTISAMKAKIHEETGMPPGKQKLQYEGIFFKDSNSLAFYNVVPNSTVHLQVKERGGRKK